MLAFRSLLLILFFALSGWSSFAQQLIEGQVKDADSKEPLAFVNLIFNNNSRLGVSTNIEGKFSYSSSVKISSITLKYVGYASKTIQVSSTQNFVTIELSKTSVKLDEVVVVAGENPANRIIREVIKNRDLHNPEKLKSFSYSSYNKTIFDYKFNASNISDSAQARVNKKLKGGHVLVMESATERKFLGPDLTQEVILGSRVSGFTNPTFTAIATDFQPFSFYDDNIKILDQNYLNPISGGSLSKYDFRIEDTLFYEVDTTFILSFKPKKGKNFDGLVGELYISTKGYAIKNVLAQPAEKGFIDLNIQQEYSLVNGENWFPSQLSFEISAKHYPTKAIGFSGNGKSFISEVVINPELNRSDFSATAVKSMDDATKKDSLFWQTVRPKPLTKREEITFKVVDSIGKKEKFDLLLTAGEKIAVNKIPLGFADVDLANTVVVNKVENFRLGLGLFSNERLSKTFTLGGFGGYGLRDKTWKYGGTMEYVKPGETEFQVKVGYLNSLLEVGRSNLDLFEGSLYGFRSFLAARMERVEQIKLTSGIRLFNYLKVKASVSQSAISPYAIDPSIFAPPATFADFQNLESNITIRYSYGERLVQTLGRNMSLGSKYPVFLFSWSHGLAGEYGDWSYNKLEASIGYKVFNKNLGETKFKARGGYVNSPLPYGLLFTGEGSFDKQFGIVIEDFFQTQKPYEFLSDQYLSLFVSHNFGSLLFKVKKFAPDIVVSQNAGWGSLSPINAQFGVDYSSKEKGFFESGLQLQNLVKLNYLNVAYLGFGFGAFYRWGHYSSSSSMENLALKISINFTSN